MRHHIGHRKVTICPKLAGHGVEKSCVQIDLLVIRAIKWPGGTRRGTTGRFGDIAVQHQRGRRVGLAGLRLQHAFPDVLGIGQRHRDEIAGGLLTVAQRPLGHRSSRAAAVQQRRQIDPKEPADQDDRQDAQAPAADTDAAAPA